MRLEAEPYCHRKLKSMQGRAGRKKRHKFNGNYPESLGVSAAGQAADNGELLAQSGCAAICRTAVVVCSCGGVQMRLQLWCDKAAF